MAEFILKDRNGKDRTFNKETIYVQGTDGELKSFTHGAGNPVVQPLNVTENGEYPVPDGVDGFAPVTVNVPDIPAVIHPLSITENGTYTAPANVDGYNPIVVEVPSEEPVLQDKTITENGAYSADEGFDGLGTVTVNIPDPTKTVILAEQEFSGFVMDSTFGAFSPGYVTPALFTLNNGETYHVKWDGTEYECVAFTFRYNGMDMVVIGNGTSLGLSGNGEPFLITYNAAYNNTQLFSTETTDSHTVGIWQDVVQEIKLQDKTITENGEYTADSGFDGLGKVTVDVAGSGGGNIPSGLYYVADETPLPNKYGQYFFTLNGELYLYTWSTSSSSYGDNYIYKYENGTPVKKFTFQSAFASRRSCTVEYNGKVHTFSWNADYVHYTYDDVNGAVKKSNLPDRTRYNCFVQNEKLKAYLHPVSSIYVWDENTDTWSVEATFNSGEHASRYFCMCNGTCYCVDMKTKEMYLYENNTLTFLYTLNFGEFGNLIIHYPTIPIGRYIYFRTNAMKDRYLYKLNVETGEFTKLGKMFWDDQKYVELYYLEGYGLKYHGVVSGLTDVVVNTNIYEVV